MAAALTALLMLTYACVVSTVMQVEMALPGAMMSLCTGPPAGGAMANMTMAGMSMDHARPARPSSKPRDDRGHQSQCPYCAAAAHIAIVGGSAPVLASAAFTFAAFHSVSSLGPRGPPQVQPRARGPPSDPTPV